VSTYHGDSGLLTDHVYDVHLDPISVSGRPRRSVESHPYLVGPSQESAVARFRP